MADSEVALFWLVASVCSVHGLVIACPSALSRLNLNSVQGVVGLVIC